MTHEEIKRANGLLFERLAILLNERPDFINTAMVADLTAKFGLAVPQAYSLLLCAALGFDTDFEFDKQLWDSYSPHMIHHLDENGYLSDPFYKAVSLGETASKGEWALKRFTIQPFTAFVCGDPIKFPNGMVIPQIGFFDCVYTYPGVTQNGREWMTLLPNEIITQRVPIKKARGKVLTYGLGLGYYAIMCALKPEVSSVTVVERDENVITLFKNLILPRFDCGDKITVVTADAFDYARNTAPDGGFDYVFADIWHDPTDGVELYKKFKSLEIDKHAQYDYWIEDTLKLYM